MIIKIIAIVIGVLILGAGLYYLSKEKHDPESKKIYGVISAVGAVIAVAAAILLLVEGHENRAASRGKQPCSACQKRA